MQMTVSHHQKADAVLELAQSFFDYGQHERVQALLDLHDWLAPAHDQAFDLRVRSLLKLRMLKEAQTLCETVNPEIGANYLAEIYWGLGEKGLGDAYFRNAHTAT